MHFWSTVILNLMHDQIKLERTCRPVLVSGSLPGFTNAAHPKQDQEPTATLTAR